MATEEQRIRIVTILGTVRPGSYTGKALALVTNEIESHTEVVLDQIDPIGLDLPFPGQADTVDAKELREIIKRATGVIIATPEYHGSFSSVTKLIIENLGFPSVLATKPVALLGVAAGQIGAIKSLEGLGSVCAHVGALVLPGPVSVANVRTVFDAEGRCLDADAEKRIRGVATSLLDYIHGYICPRHTLEAMVRGEAA